MAAGKDIHLASEQKIYPNHFSLNIPGIYEGVFDVEFLHLRFTQKLKNSGYRVYLNIENDRGKKTTELTYVESGPKPPRTKRYSISPSGVEGYHLGEFVRPGDNKVYIEAIAKDGTKKSSKGVTFLNPGSTFMTNGVRFVFEDPESYDRYGTGYLSELTRIISAMNIFMEPGFKVEGIILQKAPEAKPGDRSKAEEGSRQNYTVDARPGYRSIMMDENALGDYLISRLTVVHEAAHHFHVQIQVKDRQKWASFVKLFEKMDEASHKQFMVFEPFAEHRYDPTLPKSFGHPHDKPEELFASASTVLKYFGNGFVKQVEEMLRNTNASDRAMVRQSVLEVARAVVNMYMENKNCPKNFFHPELLKFIGMEQGNAMRLKQ